jgi:hypothetical protein
MLPDVRDRQHLLTVHKRARKVGLDLEKYNHLKESIYQLESDLTRLRDPVNPFLPPSMDSTTTGSQSGGRIPLVQSPLHRIQHFLASFAKK